MLIAPTARPVASNTGAPSAATSGVTSPGDAVAPLPRLGEIGPKGVRVGDACRRWGAEFGFEQRREQFVFGEGEQGAGASAEVQWLGSADVELEDPDRGGIGVDCR
jgi:hypothetical protein